MMLVIATCAGFTSCGDDDDDDDLPGANSLVGVWEESGDGYSFSLTLNADGTGILAESEKGSSHTTEIEWEASENMIRIYADGGDDYWYYRIKGGSLYLYPTREDYDLDDPSYVCGKTGNGGSIDDKPSEDVNNSLIGKWEAFDKGDEFRLILNADGTGSYYKRYDDGSEFKCSGKWRSTETMIIVYSDDDDESFYYRLKEGKLYIYLSRSDYDRDDYDYLCEKTGNGGSIDKPDNGGGNDKPGTGATNDLCHTWVMEGYIPGEGHYRSSMTFKSDGTCFISEQSSDIDGSYTTTVNYSVEGDLSKGATLKLWGKTVDGDFITLIYIATISSDGKTLGLIGIGGEAEGDDYKLTRQ